MPVVSTVAALVAALHSASPGEVIKVAPGEYSQVLVKWVSFSEPVRVVSADPARPAVFHGFELQNSSGLEFSNIDFDAQGATDRWYAFRVVHSKNLVFRADKVHGDLHAPHPWAQLNGFYVNQSENITFKDCSFSHLSAGVVVGGNENVRIEGNDFADLSKGGIEMGGSSNVQILDNTFHDFDTAPTVHGDALQIFTWGTKASAHDITVSGNAYWRGAGVPVQVYFIQDETGSLPFRNLTVTDNLGVGGMWNSIMISHATGKVVVKNNVLASWPGQNVVGGGQTNLAAWIRIDKLVDVNIVVAGNAAQNYLADKKAISPPSGNKTLGGVNDGGRELRAAWVRTHPVAGPRVAQIVADREARLGAGASK